MFNEQNCVLYEFTNLFKGQTQYHHLVRARAHSHVCEVHAREIKYQIRSISKIEIDSTAIQIVYGAFETMKKNEKKITMTKIIHFKIGDSIMLNFLD